MTDEEIRNEAARNEAMAWMLDHRKELEELRDAYNEPVECDAKTRRKAFLIAAACNPRFAELIIKVFMLSGGLMQEQYVRMMEQEQELPT